MKISRAWNIPNKNTFTIKPIREFVERHIQFSDFSIDPFAGHSTIATITNDLNPEMNTYLHVDALDFLKLFEDETVDVVLYDPPYSSRQVSEVYKGYGIKVTKEMTSAKWRADHMDEISRILKPGGKVLCFGWSTNGCGKKRGMKMIEVLVVAHGGSKYDTLCTAEIKEERN